MDYPTHDDLDGDLVRDELGAEECGEPAALEATIGSVVNPLRSAPVPDLAARVMARVAETRSEPSMAERVAAAARRPMEWLWTPRPLTIRLRPAYAIGTLGVLSLFMALAPFAASMSSRDGPQGEAAALAAAPRIYVQFRLEAEGASRVALAGSFTGWKPAYELRETSPGIWSILLPLRPGIHDYAFVVDGKGWVADPHALQVDDGFGGTNSRIALPAPPADRRRS